MKKLSAQSGIVHIIAPLVVIVVIALAAVWFLFSKGGLEIGKTSMEDKIASLQPKPFKDISGDNKNYTAIKYLAREGVVEADDNGNFNPDEKLTRAEWAVMLVKLTGITPDQNVYKNCFSDVGEESNAAAICFAKEQDWLEGFNTGDVSRSYWRLTQPVLAQEGGQNFNSGNPAKKSEAIDSLSRLMRWPTDQPVAFVKERKIIEEETGDNLTKGEAAGTIHRSLATVSLNQKVYSPKLDAQVERYGVEHLVDLDEKLAKERRKQAAEIARLRGKRYAELLGEKAAAEILAEVEKYGTQEAESEAYLKRARAKNYKESLDEDKARGREAPSFNVLEPLQQVFSTRGISISAGDVIIYKRSPADEYDKQEKITDNPVIKSRESATISLPLDENYNVLARADWAKARYGLRIVMGTFYQEGRSVGHLSLQIGDFETGALVAAGESKWRSLDSLERLELMFAEAIADLEVSLGRRFGSLLTTSVSSTPKFNKAPVIERVDNTQLHGSFEERPHRYLFKVKASDPEGGSLTFVWEIDCGYFIGPVNGLEVEWRYDTPGECVDAKVRVIVSDKENLTSQKTQNVF